MSLEELKANMEKSKKELEYAIHNKNILEQKHIVEGVVAGAVKGLFTLLISIPLVIMYYKASDIIKLLKKKEREKNDNVNLSERKEVEFVSSRDRKKGVKVEKKKILKLKNLVEYQKGQVVSKTLVQNELVSV